LSIWHPIRRAIRLAISFVTRWVDAGLLSSTGWKRM